jgi:formate dehydrogenase maturation protein FdhE
MGALQMGRLRRVFFERELADFELQLMADPAEQQLLVLPQGPAEEVLQNERIAQALEQVGLAAMVPSDQARWQRLDALVAIPWLEQR